MTEEELQTFIDDLRAVVADPMQGSTVFIATEFAVALLERLDSLQSEINAVPALPIKVMYERAQLRSDIKPDSARGRNYATAIKHVATWLEQVQP